MTQNQRTQLTSRLKIYHCAIALVVAMTAVIPGPVNARDQTPTAEEKEACMEDVFRLCSSHIPDRTAITACLRSKQASLSQQCRYVISVRDTSKKSSDSK
ncbi:MULTISPECIES: hypothetical protein [unclassified Bradyrhizobium]|uniref:hypothetical protein n=1 Tax=unclassified Bradyrhizobium TaxID=2631580 RepID=UPI00247A5FFA|nr:MULTISPECIES: hypothetical protein [unclassified Bradyrhizobium]WGR73214.1 hypothetical protein MTX24_10445 [Bradyrhizobium sp. ISRA426]WGR78053.1 hypothetical protein MTX21_35415 [Bradyrhizobium sp. ISRA430]WGR88454.1 hypothetical protein MTX25_10455 [Bradyrhizobium sp. ISRA432]